MNIPSKDELARELQEARISKRLVKELRYAPTHITHLDERDFLAITTKSGNEGVIWYNYGLTQFELQRRAPNAAGRVEAIICDICATWQRGTNSAVLTLKKSPTRTISHLVCADLDCSLHVRSLTTASTLSRTQLREHITPQGRINRLNERLRKILSTEPNE